MKYLLAFAIIFVLLALFALLLRRLTGGRLSLPADRGRGRQPRLGIVDVYDLDRQRQLILLRRDNVEHLLLIGGPNDVIVETNIVRTPGGRVPAAPPVEQTPERPDLLTDRSLEPSPRPLVEATQRPEPVVARFGPAEPMRSDGPGRGGPAVQEPFLKPDVVALSPAAATQPGIPPAQPLREAPREPPSAPKPVQRAAPAKAAPPPPREVPVNPPQPPPPLRPAPDQPARPAAPQPTAARGPELGGGGAVLSDMAKQLEEALKRPLSGGRPEPGLAPVQNQPAPQPDIRPLRPTTVTTRAAPAAFTAAPGGSPPPAAAPPRDAFEPSPAQRPAPAPVARMRPVPEPPANTSEPPPAPRAPAPGQDQVDPFSVEEIEEEFARLLGRPIDRSDRS